MSDDTRQDLLMVMLVLIVNIPAAYHVFVIVMHDLRASPGTTAADE